MKKNYSKFWVLHFCLFWSLPFTHCIFLRIIKFDQHDNYYIYGLESPSKSRDLLNLSQNLVERWTFVSKNNDIIWGWKTKGLWRINVTNIRWRISQVIFHSEFINPILWLGGGRRTLGSDCTLTRSTLSWFPISEWALRLQTSTLIMVPIKFWQNSDLSKKNRTYF